MRELLPILLALACRLAFAADSALTLPDWLEAPKNARDTTRHAIPDQFDSSYNLALAPDGVVKHYRARLESAGIPFQANFDGIGTTLSASTENMACVIRISSDDDSSRVKVSCARKLATPLPTPAPAAIAISTAEPAVVTPVVERTTAPARPPSSHLLMEVRADLHTVEAEITASLNADDQSRGVITRSLSSARVATLKQVKEMLEQTMVAVKAGATLHPSAADTQQLAEVDKAIALAREKISDQEVEVSRRSGTIAYGLNNAALETLRDTLAVLLQRRMQFKYSALY